MSADSSKRPFTEAQTDVVAQLVAGLKQDIRAELNPLRERLDMPVLKALPPLRPRHRVQAGSRPWLP